MSRLEKLKEEIGWLKMIFGVLIATDISLIVWMIQNYLNANKLFLIFSVGGIILITIAIIWINKVAYRKIDELEDL